MGKMVAALIAAGVSLWPFCSSVFASSLTAEEAVAKGREAYAQGRYGDALQAWTALESEYGRSAEAAPLLRSLRYAMALSALRVGDFGAAAGNIDAALALQPPLTPAEVQELTFWNGVVKLKNSDPAGARKTFESFVALFPPGAENDPRELARAPAAVQLPAARLLIGQALMLEGKNAEAAEVFARLSAAPPSDERGQAAVLQLYCLLESGSLDRASQLVMAEFPRMGELTQLVGFQSLVLEVGDRLMAAGQLRQAIACFQRVWPAERLLRHQRARLETLEKRHAAAREVRDLRLEKSLEETLEKVGREVTHFEALPEFDAAVRLRMATAYHLMHRTREAALILEEMVGALPPGPTLESAGVALVQCWYDVARWPRVVASADSFAAKFPKSAQLPRVLYLKGLALQSEERLEEAVAVFDALAQAHPKSDSAPRAVFMAAFTRLLAEDHEAAIEGFREFSKKFSDHDLAAAADYWTGMGHSLAGEHEQARARLKQHAKKFPDSPFAGSAAYRAAYCAQQLEDFSASIKELRAYLKAFPGHEENAEAGVLLGDALLHEGRLEEGLAAFAAIPEEGSRFYEEGFFKSLKALRLLEKTDQVLSMSEQFVRDRPKSPRVAEAITHAVRIYRERGDLDRARGVVWESIERWGNDPAIWSVDDLFPTLQRLYPGEEKSLLSERLRDLARSAESSHQPVLQARALWARGRLLAGSDPALARPLLLLASRLVRAEETNPLLLADFADAHREDGRPEEAAAIARDLLKWNPRAPQKDRALADLGTLALERGDKAEAERYFVRFRRETTGSQQEPRVLLALAQLRDQEKKSTEARELRERVLKSPFSTAPQKVEALYHIGEGHLREKRPDLAVPYFQRIYVMYARWPEWVAKAYWQSGLAFEDLGDTESARRTYQEMAARQDLAPFPETRQAAERLQAMAPSHTP